MKKAILTLLALLPVFSAGSQPKYASNTWRQIIVNCKLGFIDPTGKIMLEPAFENASSFSEGLAFVWSYPGYKNDLAKVPLGETYKDYEHFGNKGNRLTGIIDERGKYVFEPKVNFHLVRPFQDGIAYVEVDNKVIIIDKNGREVRSYNTLATDARYEKILRAARIETTLKMGYMNAFRETVYITFDDCKEFSGNFAAVKLGGQYGYINRQGNLTVTPQFAEAGPFLNGYATVAVNFGSPSARNRLYGMIDTLGNFVIPPTYGWLGDPVEGRVAFVEREGEAQVYGYLDLHGQVVIPARFSRANEFHEGLAAVDVGEQTGYINLQGSMVIQPAFTFGGEFKSGTAFVGLDNGKNGIINTSGQFVWGPVRKSDCE
jgi:hypothetical protein